MHLIVSELYFSPLLFCSQREENNARKWGIKSVEYGTWGEQRIQLETKKMIIVSNEKAETHKHMHIYRYISRIQSRDFPGCPVAKTLLYQCKRAQVWSLVKGLDPTCCNEDPNK